jgi:hypothetical protein
MHERAPGTQVSPTGSAPVSVHFVNNVLAAAASYIEIEPDTARDVLAGLGACLSHRLRDARPAALAEELDHVATYLRLEQARFPGRLETELPSAAGLPAAHCAPGAVQAPLARSGVWPVSSRKGGRAMILLTLAALAQTSSVADALGQWLGQRTGRVHVALRARLDGSTLEAQLDRPDDPSSTAERIRIRLSGNSTGGAA